MYAAPKCIAQCHRALTVATRQSAVSAGCLGNDIFCEAYSRATMWCFHFSPGETVAPSESPMPALNQYRCGRLSPRLSCSTRRLSGNGPRCVSQKENHALISIYHRRGNCMYQRFAGISHLRQDHLRHSLHLHGHFPLLLRHKLSACSASTWDHAVVPNGLFIF